MQCFPVNFLNQCLWVRNILKERQFSGVSARKGFIDGLLLENEKRSERMSAIHDESVERTKLRVTFAWSDCLRDT